MMIYILKCEKHVNQLSILSHSQSFLEIVLLKVHN